MKVSFKDLRQKIEELLKVYENDMGEFVVFDNDFYWEIADNELFNPYDIPTDLTLGQISDDFFELNKNTIDNIVFPHDLKRIAIILKALYLENPTPKIN